MVFYLLYEHILFFAEPVAFFLFFRVFLWSVWLAVVRGEDGVAAGEDFFLTHADFE